MLNKFVLRFIHARQATGGATRRREAIIVRLRLPIRLSSFTSKHSKGRNKADVPSIGVARDAMVAALTTTRTRTPHPFPFPTACWSTLKIL